MKKLLTTLFLFAFLMTSIIGVSALEEPMRSVDAIIAEIRTDLGITVDETIDVTLVDQVLLEELGDSVMEAYIGDSEQHEALDVYYGGDDSETLTDLHIQIGEDYLNGYPITMMTFMRYGYANQTNTNDYNANQRYGMMGRNYRYNDTNDQTYYGMMGRNYRYNDTNDQTYYGMMGRNYTNQNGLGSNYANINPNDNYGMMNNFSSGGMIMGFIGFALIIGLLVYLFSTQNRAHGYTTINSNNAMNILKERYARGEITREEFLQISSTIK